MSLYDNEENAIVNNAAKDSETPSDLVGKGENNELSPNPAGFGFTKQLIVDELPESGVPNTLYLLKVLNNGLLVGYRHYKWTPTEGYTLVGPTPNVKLEKGTHEQKAVEVNQPQNAPEKVFNGDVVFKGDIVYKGRKLPEEDEIGSIVKPNPTLAGTETLLTGLEIDGTKYKVGGGTKLYKHVMEVPGPLKITMICPRNNTYNILQYAKLADDLNLYGAYVEVGYQSMGNGRLLSMKRDSAQYSSVLTWYSDAGEIKTLDVSDSVLQGLNNNDTITEL